MYNFFWGNLQIPSLVKIRRNRGDCTSFHYIEGYGILHFQRAIMHYCKIQIIMVGGDSIFFYKYMFFFCPHPFSNSQNTKK